MVPPPCLIGDLILFMTQDAVPADVYLVEKLVSAFEKEKVAAAYARQLPDQRLPISSSVIREVLIIRKRAA